MSECIIREGRIREERDETSKALMSETWLNDEGLPHRVGGPAVRKFAPDTGRLVEERWYDHGVENRTHDKPAITRWSPKTGVKTAEIYILRGFTSRVTNNPSQIYFDETTGNVVREVYHNLRGFNRDDGPAWIQYDPITGIVLDQEFFIDGIRVPARHHRPILDHKPKLG